MILVTGATGLVGTHLLVKLIQEGHQVRALFRTEAKKKHAKKVFAYYFSTEEHIEMFDAIDWVKGSINNIPLLTEAFAGITQVYHCAALISFDPSHYKILRKTNIKGTANIVNLCLIHTIQKLCYVSSIAVFGETPNGIIDENTEWNPESFNSVYAITKYGAEMEVWRGMQEGLRAVIVNPGIIIGPGFFEDGSGYLFKKIYKGLPYYTTGVTGYVAIDDVITIMYRLMNSSSPNERYIVVGENLSFRNAFAMIAKALHSNVPKKKVSPFVMKIAFYIQWIGHSLFRTKRFIYKSSVKDAFSAQYYQNDKIKKELIYSFKPIEKSISETADFFLNHRNN